MTAGRFVTKDSGERQTFSTGMQRDVTKGKLRPDLVYMPLLVRWAELMGRGAEKYGERNWEKARTAEELDRFKESAFRHFMQWYLGLNPEEDHAAAVLFNIGGAEYVRARTNDEDSGPIPEAGRRVLITPAPPRPAALPDRWPDWPQDHVGPV